ncbi:MAG TPA: ferric reductase-like transmembrane domain-containing protein [Terriglobales bacterium]|nr:ferric reductase-like transmembrane domain-containing protein [Terriglobales bacterium]
MTAIDLSGDLGLVALALLTINLLLGLLLSVRYDPLRHWPHRLVDIFQLHNWTGYIALAACVLHPLPLLDSARLPFTWLQIAWPIHAPSQPRDNWIGAIALYLVALVVVTSYFRVALGRRSWKLVHYGAYVAALLFFLHSLLLDPELLNRPVDWLDGEKVFVEVCLLLVFVSSLARWKYGQRHPQRLRVTPATRYVPGFKGAIQPQQPPPASQEPS